MEKNNILSCKFIAEGTMNPKTEIVLKNGDFVETYNFGVSHDFLREIWISQIPSEMKNDLAMEEFMKICENRVPDRVDSLPYFFEMNPSYRSILSPFMRDSKIDEIFGE
jgi:hypothetical protein